MNMCQICLKTTDEVGELGKKKIILTVSDREVEEISSSIFISICKGCQSKFPGILQIWTNDKFLDLLRWLIIGGPSRLSY